MTYSQGKFEDCRGLRPAKKLHNLRKLKSLGLVARFGARANTDEYFVFTSYRLQHCPYPPLPLVKIRLAGGAEQGNKMRTGGLIRKFFRFCERH